MSLKFKILKTELKAFLKKIALGGNIEDAIVSVVENGLIFKGVSKSKSFYCDVLHKCKVDIIDNSDIENLVINNINLFITTIDKIEGDTVSIDFDGDLIKFNSKKKDMELVASTPENINSNLVSSIEFKRKEKLYKCSAGEYKFDKAFTLIDKDIISIINDAKDLSINKFEFDFKVKENKIDITISNAGDSITTHITTDLEVFENDFKVKFGDDFKKIVEVLVKDNEELIFFVDGSDDTNLLIYANGCYYFMVNDNDDQEFK